jgi:GDPmannose 4,6-dehydratase
LECAGLKGEVSDFVDIDQKLIRPSEVPLLIGDSSKAKRALGWSPTIDFNGLVELMVKNDIQIESR